MSWLSLAWMLIVVASACWLVANLLTIVSSPLIKKSVNSGDRKH